MRVLVVEDALRACRDGGGRPALGGYGHRRTGDGQDALARLELVAYDVVALDRHLPLGTATRIGASGQQMVSSRLS